MLSGVPTVLAYPRGLSVHRYPEVSTLGFRLRAALFDSRMLYQLSYLGMTLLSHHIVADKSLYVKPWTTG